MMRGAAPLTDRPARSADGRADVRPVPVDLRAPASGARGLPGPAASALWGAAWRWACVAVPIWLARCCERVTVRAVAVAVAALTAHTAVNARPGCAARRRRPTDGRRPAVAVLLPLRDEADRVAPCLRALLAQRGVPGLPIVVLDDGSTDGTAEVVRRVVGGDPRVALRPRRRPAARAGSASRTPATSSPRSPRRRDRAGLRRRRRGARAATRSPRPWPLLRAARATCSRPYPRIVADRRASGWSSRCCSGRG